MSEMEKQELQADGVNRREFMKRSGATVAGVTMFSGGTLLIGAADAWAQSLSTLSENEGKALLQMCRDLYPHDRIPDDLYVKVVESFDGAAKGDAVTAQLISDGVKDLNNEAKRVGKKDYVGLSRESDRVKVLEKMESTAFFQKIRGDMIAGLYNQPAVWKLLGYEGASAHLGGYINRGFNDVNWL